MFAAQVANALNAGTDSLDRLHSVQDAEQQRIAWNALDAEGRFSHAGGQPARTDNFEPVREQVNLHIGGGAVVPMGQGVDDRLTNGFFRQLRPLLPLHALNDVLDIDLGENPGHHPLHHRIDVAVEVASVENAHLIGSHEESARNVGADIEPADVPGQQPGAGVRHPAVFTDQVQVAQCGRGFHLDGNLGTALKQGPVFFVEVSIEQKLVARGFVEVDRPFLVEELADLLP